MVKDDSGLRSVSKLLGLKRMREAHGAEEITKELLEVILDYEIRDLGFL